MHISPDFVFCFVLSLTEFRIKKAFGLVFSKTSTSSAGILFKRILWKKHVGVWGIKKGRYQPIKGESFSMLTSWETEAL
jgi:hypothetical protein